VNLGARSVNLNHLLSLRDAMTSRRVSGCLQHEGDGHTMSGAKAS
jgi:hypothetical protein